MTETVYLSLGSNLGDREQLLARAIQELQDADVLVTRRSSLYETEPQDVACQPWFLNMVVECETDLNPPELLRATQEVERTLGRTRTVNQGPRTVDIDILMMGSTIIETHSLTIPHPRMKARRFVLEPLIEIAPELPDPETGKLFAELLRNVTGQIVRRL